MKVIVDQTKCIGCGVCADVADKVFEIKDGVSTVLEPVDLNSDEVLEAVKMAIDVCPVKAISLEE